MMGVAAVTKKRGGYTNTKLHGMIAWAGLILAGGGLYVIYQHKESMGKNHYTTYHSWGESVIAFIDHDYLCSQVSYSVYHSVPVELFYSVNSWSFSIWRVHHDGLGWGGVASSRFRHR
jgi:hypothetical protein